MWGSTVGKRVTWTPEMTIYDRPFLKIGDRVIMGSKVSLSAHIVSPRGKALTLILGKILIKKNAFIGAHFAISPNVIVGEGALILFGKTLHPGTIVKDGEIYDR